MEEISRKKGENGLQVLKYICCKFKFLSRINSQFERPWNGSFQFHVPVVNSFSFKRIVELRAAKSI